MIEVFFDRGMKYDRGMTHSETSFTQGSVTWIFVVHEGARLPLFFPDL